MRIIDVTYPDVSNGVGTRVSVWVAGCAHQCSGCQNMHTHNYIQGKSLSDVKEKIFTVLELEYIDGITFTGGDPLFQTESNLSELLSFICEIREKHPNKDIWIYTGFTWEELFTCHQLAILSNIDVLVDGRFEKDNKGITLAYRGSCNQRIIDVQRSLDEGKVVEKEELYSEDIHKD